MIDLSKAGTTQLTLEDGTVTDWVCKLDGEEMYRLPAKLTVQDTFTIRDEIQRLVEKSFMAGKAEADALCEVKINRIVENGDAKLDALKQENERLNVILEQTFGEESL